MAFNYDGSSNKVILMDLLWSAYSTASDDDDENGDRPERKRVKTESSAPKLRSMAPYRSVPAPTPPNETPLPGRYVSKRERAALASGTVAAHTISHSLPTPVQGHSSILQAPYQILPKLKQQGRGYVRLGQIPRAVSVSLKGHTKAVNTVVWSRTYAHLLASASMDNTVSIWNVWDRDQKRVRVLNYHNAAVKDVKWSEQGSLVLSCGYDCASRLIDVERGTEIQVFRDNQVVGVVKFHPENFNLFLSGGSKGLLKMWDIRLGNVVYEFTQNLGPILEAEFSSDGRQLISSSDESRSNVSENSIIVWDVSRQIPLSNQVYVEAYTCPCVRYHPFDPYFIAQSNGNYIAIFSSKSPFRLDKYKRYESHGVLGFPIKCNFSIDGDIVASGSSDGCIYYYNSKTSQLIQMINAHEQACIDVAFHPVISAVATCSWTGEVLVCE